MFPLIFQNISKDIDIQLYVKRYSIKVNVYNASESDTTSYIVSIAGDKLLSVLDCNMSESCYIICNASVSCFGSTIHSGSMDTYILCYDEFSCTDVSIIAQNQYNESNSSFSLICYGESSCSQSTVNVSSFDFISLECVHSDSCGQAIINIKDTMIGSLDCYELSTYTIQKRFYCFLANFFCHVR